MSRGKVYVKGIPAGIIEKRENMYIFTYDEEYYKDTSKPPVSLTFPKLQKEFTSKVLFSFFFGLLAEGDLKMLQCRTLKIDENDHFTRLLKTTGKDVIGSVTIEEIK